MQLTWFSVLVVLSLPFSTLRYRIMNAEGNGPSSYAYNGGVKDPLFGGRAPFPLRSVFCAVQC